MKYPQERKQAVLAKLALIWTTAVPRSAGQITPYPVASFFLQLSIQW